MILYSKDQKHETGGTRGKKTRIASVLFRYRIKGTAAERHQGGFSESFWWYLGNMNGNSLEMTNQLKTFKNITQMISRTIGSQKTGNDTAMIKIPLKDLCPFAVALLKGSSYRPKPKYTLFPGIRQYTSAVAGPFVTLNVYALTFTTTPLNGEASTPTVVSETFTTDDSTTKSNIVDAILENDGILSAVWTTNTLVIKTKPKTIMTITVQATNVGGTAAAVTNTSVDTSVITLSIDASNGTISEFKIPLATGDATKMRTVFDNAPEGALPQIEIFTGGTLNGGDDLVVEPEYPLATRLEGNYLVLNEALSQLPLDLSEIRVVAGFDEYPGGDSLKEIELQIIFRDHSNKTVEVFYIPSFSTDESTTYPVYKEDGYTGTLGGPCLDEIFNVPSEDGETSDDILLPWISQRNNSAVAPY